MKSKKSNSVFNKVKNYVQKNKTEYIKKVIEDNDQKLKKILKKEGQKED